MNDTTALTLLTALAQPTRLGAFRLLLRHAPHGLAAGDIARTLEATQNTLSSHLQTLRDAGLAVSERQGRKIIYHAAPAPWVALNAFIMAQNAEP